MFLSRNALFAVHRERAIGLLLVQRSSSSARTVPLILPYSEGELSFQSHGPLMVSRLDTQTFSAWRKRSVKRYVKRKQTGCKSPVMILYGPINSDLTNAYDITMYYIPYHYPLLFTLQGETYVETYSQSKYF